MKQNLPYVMRIEFLVLISISLFFLKSQPLFSQISDSYSTTSFNTCNGAIVMNCENNFSAIPLAPSLPGVNSFIETCLGEISNNGFSEQWVSVNFSGAPVYYIDAYGANVGMEIYTGTCGNLQLEKCEPATGEDTFIAFFPPVNDHYFLRIMSNNLNDENDDIEVFVNCYFPGPACTTTIENIELASCVNEDGKITGTIQGSVTPIPNQSNVYVEVVTNEDFYSFTATCHDQSFSVPIEVQGAEITSLMVFVGDSENGCFDARSNVLLPTVSCDANVTTFKGSVNWDSNCNKREAQLKLYTTGTNAWVQSYSGVVTKMGKIDFESLPLGEYDIYLTIKGFLTKKFNQVTISETEEIFDYGPLIQGDVNGDNKINIDDCTILSSYFFTNIPLDSNMKHMDQNCDGFINLIDFSLLNRSINLLGDTPSSNIEKE